MSERGGHRRAPRPWQGRRRATWRLSPPAVPAAVLLTLGMLAVAYGVVRAVVGPVPVPWDAWAADGWWVTPLVVAVVLTGAMSDVGEAGADLWLRRRQVASTPAARARVRRWLRLTRTARAVGLLAPLVATTLATWLFNEGGLPIDHPTRAALLGIVSGDGRPDGLTLAAGGYAVGALLAEALRPAVTGRRGAPRAGGRGVADLRPRELAAYAQPLARWAPRVLAVGALLTVWASGGRDVPVTSVLRVVGTTLVTLVVLEPARWWVVHRRQSVTEPELADVDDAARASTLHGTSGAAIAIIGGVWATYVQNLMLDWQGPARHLAWVSLVLGVGSLGVWAGFGTDLVWTVRRGGRPPGGAADDTRAAPEPAVS